MRRHRLTTLVALPLLAPALAVPMVLAPSAPAAAGPGGSIVYIKDHDVHNALPDGSGERALTADGTAENPWRSPDQATNGTVVAARGTVVYRMDQWGTVLNSFDPPDAVDNRGDKIGGTVTRTAISPDGSKIAYTFQHYTCPPSGCRDRWVTAITEADRFVEGHHFAYGYHDHPTWISETKLLLNGIEYDGIQVHTLERGTLYWFDDSKNVPPFDSTERIADPALSPDGRLLATVRSEPTYPANHAIVLYDVEGDVRSEVMPVRPTPLCTFTGGGSFGSPTFAPDGTAVAWHESDGIWRLDSPRSCSNPRLLIAGGQQPSWSPAALQTSRPTYSFTTGARPGIKGKAKVGKRLVASAGTWTPAPQKVRYQWLRNGKKIKRATRPAYRVTKADRGRRLAVRVVVTRAGYRPAIGISKPVRVRPGR